MRGDGRLTYRHSNICTACANTECNIILVHPAIIHRKWKISIRKNKTKTWAALQIYQLPRSFLSNHLSRTRIHGYKKRYIRFLYQCKLWKSSTKKRKKRHLRMDIKCFPFYRTFFHTSVLTTIISVLFNTIIGTMWKFQVVLMLTWIYRKGESLLNAN